MQMRRAIVAAALLVVIAALSAFSTNPAVGTAQRAWWSSAPPLGRIMGQAGDSLGAGGARYVSFASNATSVTGIRLSIYSKDIVNGVDTLAVLGSWSGRFARGVDSIYVVQVSGAQLSATVGN